MKFIDKDLKAVQEARVLMEEAAEAKKTLALFEQKKLDRIAACMMDALELKLEQLTEEAVRVTAGKLPTVNYVCFVKRPDRVFPMENPICGYNS